MVENKNTFPYKTNITILKETLIPGVGDELVFCKNEDDAFEHFMKSADETREPNLMYEPLDEVLMTGIYFKCSDIHGKMAHTLYFGSKEFGFFGYRRKRYGGSEGHFFLYETQK